MTGPKTIAYAAGLAVVLALGTGCTTTRTAQAPSASPSSAASSAHGKTGLLTPVARRVFALPSTGKKSYAHGGPQLVASVYGIYRAGGHARLAVGLTIGGEDAMHRKTQLTGLLSAEHDHTKSIYDTTGLTLVDPVQDKAYLVAFDRQKRCLCSAAPPVIAGSTTVVSATFAAPPQSASVIYVVLPKFGVVQGVPVTDHAPPRSITKTRPTLLRNGELGPVLTPDQDSSGPVAGAPVVDINTSVGNLDASVTQEHDKVVLAADVLFAYDKTTLTANARSRIAQTARILRKKAHGTVHVNGYTDSKGSRAYNKRLSVRRARAVRAALAKHLRGSGLRLVAKGYGEADPIAPNTTHGKDNPRGRALNRRVETVYHQHAVAQRVSATPSSTPSRPGPTGKLTLPKAIASKPVKHVSDLSVELYGLYRHGRLVTLTFGAVPRHGNSLSVRGLFSKTRADGNVSGVYLVDRHHSRRYGVARYARNWFGTTWSWEFPIHAGQTLYLTATFAAPPRGTTHMDVHVPFVSTFRHVAIT